MNDQSDNPPDGRRVFIRTLGCPKNEVDSDVLSSQLRQRGYTLVASPDVADVEIISTCGFIEPTKDQSIDAVFEAVARAKDSGGAHRRLLVTGCLAQRYGDALFTEIPEVDAVVGFNRPDQVLRALERIGSTPTGSGERVCWVEPPEAEFGTIGQARSKPTQMFSYVKISDGCDNACSFCAIPRIRGRLRTRPLPTIVEEARWLIENGAREIILVSQDSTSYGVDLGDDAPKLPELLRALDAIDGDFWIRLMYAHPGYMTDASIAAIAETEKVVKYVDIPLQHATDRMLKLMNRNIDRRRTQELLDRMRRAIGNLALRTTFIVGHPGETEDDFNELMEFAETNDFERQGAFVYSPEEKTGSFGMSDPVDLDVARERADRLAIAFDERAQRRSEALTGRMLRVLLEHPAEDMPGYWEGRCTFDAPEIDGRVLVDGGDGAAPGFADAIVTDAAGVDLTARAASGDAAGGRRIALATGMP